jgi:hypothetical protein
MTEQVATEVPGQRQQIKSKLLDGSIGAISLDTCIFSRARYQLDKGNLRRLEQFKENAFRLIFLGSDAQRGHAAYFGTF